MECQYGYCAKGISAGMPGTYCDKAKDCKGMSWYQFHSYQTWFHDAFYSKLWTITTLEPLTLFSNTKRNCNTLLHRVWSMLHPGNVCRPSQRNLQTDAGTTWNVWTYKSVSSNHRIQGTQRTLLWALQARIGMQKCRVRSHYMLLLNRIESGHHEMHWSLHLSKQRYKFWFHRSTMTQQKYLCLWLISLTRLASNDFLWVNLNYRRVEEQQLSPAIFKAINELKKMFICKGIFKAINKLKKCFLAEYLVTTVFACRRVVIERNKNG